MRLCEEKSKKRKSKAIGQTARAPPKKYKTLKISVLYFGGGKEKAPTQLVVGAFLSFISPLFLLKQDLNRCTHLFVAYEYLSHK